MERKLWNAWVKELGERKSTEFTADQILSFARRDAEQYVSIAEHRPDWMGSVEDVVAEMRSAITEAASELDDEDALADMSTMDRANLEMQLRQIADDAEQRIRASTQSLFDRIGAPKGMRGRIAAKQKPAPGAHKHYA